MLGQHTPSTMLNALESSGNDDCIAWRGADLEALYEYVIAKDLINVMAKGLCSAYTT